MFTAIFVTRLLCNIALQFNDHSDKLYGLKFKLDEIVTGESDVAEENAGISEDGVSESVETVSVAQSEQGAATVVKRKNKNNVTYTRVKYRKGGKK